MKNDVLNLFQNSKLLISRDSGILYVNRLTKTNYFVRSRDDRCFMKAHNQHDFVEYVGGREFLESDCYMLAHATATIKTLAFYPCN